MRRYGCAALIAAVIATAGCDMARVSPAAQLEQAFPPDGSVAAAAPDDRQPGDLATVQAEQVIGLTGPGGKPFEVAVRTRGDGTHLSRAFGSRTMELGARVGSPVLTNYPCAACHVPSGIRTGVDPAVDAHHDIQPVHPRETGTSCMTCHAPENVALLALGTGERATMDHAYRLCAHCHAPQVDEWAAGAHGKRLDGWQGRRVVMGCADCHNPHRPALDRRIPFPPPVIPRAGGQDR
jgi:hypothetical protein